MNLRLYLPAGQIWSDRREEHLGDPEVEFHSMAVLVRCLDAARNTYTFNSAYILALQHPD